MSSTVKSLRVNPRYDLLTPYVLINYEQTTAVNGQSWMQPYQDFYPNPLPTAPLSQFNAIRATIDLQGLHANSTTANLVCDAITADPVANGAQAWWLARHPQYAPFDPTIPPNAGGPVNAPDPNNPITSFVLIPGTLVIRPTNSGETLLNLPNELRTGQIAPWMTFQKQRITITVKASITHRNGNVVQEHPITYQCLATNATTGAYSNTTVTQIAEPVPVGLAQALYNAVSVLQYDGELTLQEQEVSGSLSVGDLFNLTGGNLSEWTTMKGMVQSITEDIDAGTTLVEFGPPKHLSAGELVDLLRVNRSRSIFYWPTLQTSGVGAGAESVALGDNTPEKNSSSTPGFTQSHVVSGAVDGSGPLSVTQVTSPYPLGLLGFGASAAFTHWTPSGPFAPQGGGNPLPPSTPGSITISTSDISGGDINNGVAVKLQKLPLCLNGTSGTMYFLCSQFIPD
jgi:hypothetical protein